MLNKQYKKDNSSLEDKYPIQIYGLIAIQKDRKDKKREMKDEC